MEGSVTFNGEGFNAIRTKLDPLIREHIKECGELTVRNAKDMSPYQTGNNRRSITVDFFKNGARDGGVSEGTYGLADNGPAPAAGQNESFRVYTQSGYGGYLETGTSRMQAQPHIKPGFDAAVAFLERELTGVA